MIPIPNFHGHGLAKIVGGEMFVSRITKEEEQQLLNLVMRLYPDGPLAQRNGRRRGRKARISLALPLLVAPLGWLALGSAMLLEPMHSLDLAPYAAVPPPLPPQTFLVEKQVTSVTSSANAYHSPSSRRKVARWRKPWPKSAAARRNRLYRPVFSSPAAGPSTPQQRMVQRLEEALSAPPASASGPLGGAPGDPAQPEERSDAPATTDGPRVPPQEVQERRREANDALRALRQR